MQNENAVTGQPRCCAAFDLSEVRIVGKLDVDGNPVPLDPQKLSCSELRMFRGYDSEGNPVATVSAGSFSLIGLIALPSVS